MSRFAFCVVALVLSGLAVRADVPAPPGQVRVPVDHVIETDRAYPNYLFCVLIGADVSWSYRCDLRPGSPVRIDGAGRGGRARTCWLVAVPRDAAAGFQTDANLIGAVLAHKVPGVLRSTADFDSFVVLGEGGPRPSVEERHRVERAGPEEGVVVVRTSAPLHRADPLVGVEESLVRWAVAGVAAAIAACGLGLWLLTRKRGAA